MCVHLVVSYGVMSIDALMGEEAGFVFYLLCSGKPLECLEDGSGE